MISSQTLGAFFLLTASLTGFSGNWPEWRGPGGQGQTPETAFPQTWNRTENVRWKLALPDRGNSTPIVWKNRIFLSQAIEKEQKRSLFCIDRANGQVLWQKTVTYTEKEPTHETNPPCSASPVTDGKHVIVSHGSAGLYCYDFEGKELWHRDLGPQRHVWGGGASPTLVHDLCVLNFGPGERTFLIAVDKKTGKTVWQHDEPGGKFGHSQSEWTGSWSTPVLTKVKDREELVMSWPHRVAAYNPQTGKELWSCEGLNPLVYTSPLIEKDIVISMGGFMGSALAVRAGGEGNVTQSHRQWLTPKNKQRIGSGVVHQGHVYILTDPGVAECIEIGTGKMVWEERLKGKGARNSSWSSLVLAGDRLLGINQSGDTFILKAQPAFELFQVNSLEEGCNASVALSDGEIFIRTFQHLWCISDKKNPATLGRK